MIKKLSGTGSIDRSVDGDSLAGKTDSDYDRSEAVSADMRFMWQLAISMLQGRLLALIEVSSFKYR